jgi:hypothetical protein
MQDDSVYDATPLETMKIHNFLHKGCGAKNLNTCVLNICVVSVVWSAQVHSSFCGF